MDFDCMLGFKRGSGYVVDRVTLHSSYCVHMNIRIPWLAKKKKKFEENHLYR